MQSKRAALIASCVMQLLSLEEVRKQIPLQSEKVTAQMQLVQKLSKQLEMEGKLLETLQQSEATLHTRYMEVHVDMYFTSLIHHTCKVHMYVSKSMHTCTQYIYVCMHVPYIYVLNVVLHDCLNKCIK